MTQARGSRDTPHAPWALVESGLRPILITLVVALLVHIVPPMVPGQSLLGWIGFALRDADEETDVPEQEVIVPIELDMFMDEDPQADHAVEPAAAPPDAPDPGFAPENMVVVPVPKAEASAPAPPPAPKPPEAKPPEKPGDGTDEEEPKEEPPPKRKIRLESAFDAAGDNNVARAEHPNVNIYIAGSELRKRDLAPMFSDLLSSVPEWEMLLGGTDIDPIADFDHVLISAPHMRNKAKWIVARVGYNVPNAKMKDAIDAVAKRTKGKWLPDHALPVASIDNDRRKVVLIEKQRQLVVMPGDAEIPKLEKVGRFPQKPTAGIFLDIVTPANMFKSKFAFPKSIQKLTLRLRLEEGGGFAVDVEMIDTDEEHALKNAAFLEAEIEKVRPIPLVSLFTKKYFIGKPTFETDGELIRVTAPVSRVQVERVMRLIKIWLKNREAQANDAAADAAKKKKKPKAKEGGKKGRRKLGPARTRQPAPKAPPKPKGLLDGLRERVED